eukprot:CAMPEP_0174359508 /NCGR_PEP_ID=MMETSP0811_2-20130205/49140_1 /TAXON_ID=73025 ORGANISM="Eutreptiella gymnastica-like, Strain CCMP1594" /NCGR_SAMPLE_ID=MMETSP0811_2 /ASSEMBLY_ACC=CAM_ASM_000667 /LENGTH=41 /DNA_ID= /DNA_START= /DNA_END= /DNA_ORIENTATION=
MALPSEPRPQPPLTEKRAAKGNWRKRVDGERSVDMDIEEVV